GVFYDDLFDFLCGDILATRDDDVLGAILQLNIAIRMPYSEVARVEPPSLEGLLGGVRLLEVPWHDVVAAHYDFAHRLPIVGYIVHGVIHYAHPHPGNDIGHALACLDCGALLE